MEWRGRWLSCAASLCLFLPLLLPAQGQVIKGGGAEVGVTAYTDRAEDYRFVTTQIVWVYSTYLNATVGVEHYDLGELDFIATDAPVPNLSPSHVILPIIAGAIALTYNLPTNISRAHNQTANGTNLVLDRQVLARIWLGQVTHWNDPDLVSLNPELGPFLPDQEIGLVWLPILGVTQVFAQALASFIDDFDPVTAAELRANGTLAYLPPVVAGKATAFNTTPPLLAYVDAMPYTLAYFLHDSGYYSTLASPIASLVNRANQTVGPAPANIAAALEDFSPSGQSSEDLPSYIVDGSGVDSYPLCLLSFVVQSRDITVADCGGSSLYIDHIVWLITNEQVAIDIEAEGYTALPPAYRIRVLNWLALLTCNGQPRLGSSILEGTGPDAPFIPSLGLFYARTVDSVECQYIAGGGQHELESGDVDYSATLYSCAPPEDNPDFRYLPVAAFAVSVGYNVPEVLGYGPLQFNLSTLAEIYMGHITSWNDEAILSLNPSLRSLMPNKPIVFILDQASSYTYPFANALAGASPEFRLKVGVGGNVTFPVAGAQYVAPQDIGGQVQITNYSIAFAPHFKFSGFQVSSNIFFFNRNNGPGTLTNVVEASLINRAGNAVRPDMAAVEAATLDVPVDEYLNADLTLSEGSASWPISSYFYILLSLQNDADCTRAANLADMVWWMVNSSEALNILNISDVLPVSDSLRSKVLDVLVQIECRKQPVMSLSGCVYNGTVCANAGSCQMGRCECTVAGRAGAFCESAAGGGGLSSAAIVAIVVSVVVAACVLVMAVLGTVWVLVLAFSRKGRREADWLIDAGELEMGELLGAGGFGEVRKAVWRGTEVAVKTMTAAFSNELNNAFLEEVSVMTSLRHPNVVLFMAAATKPPTMCIVMELMSLGSLHDALHNEHIRDIPMKLRIKLLRQAAKGMYFLHSSGIVHRDLKSLNLLLDHKWNVKVSDFGLTRLREHIERNRDADQQPQRGQGGTIHWTAPEVLNESRGIDLAAADVYAFGIIMWEVLTRRDPYPDLRPAAVAVAVLRDGARPKVPPSAPAAYVQLMRESWDYEPKQRPSFLGIMTRLGHMSKRFSATTASRRKKQVSWLDPSSSDDDNSEPDSFSSQGSSHASDLGAALYAGDGQGTVAAPTGEMAIVFSDIMRAMALWEFDPESMRDATLAHNELLRQRLVEWDGYEVACFKEGNSGEGSMCAAFKEVTKAVAWCAQVQRDLMDVDWPAGLLEHPEACEECGDNAGDDRPIFKGPRVRMGVHVGEPRRVVDPITRRVEYVGPVVNTAALITTLAHGGQVLVSDAAHKKILADKTDKSPSAGDGGAGAGETALTGDRWACVGRFEMVDNPHRSGSNNALYELRVPGLEDRFFGSTIMNQSSSSPAGENAGDAHSSTMQCTTEDAFLISANLCRWVIDFDEIEVGRQLGMGSYGLVHHARWKGIEVAVKRFIKQKLTERRLLELRAEAAFLAELSHPNLVLFIGACVKKPNLCVVTEFVKHGSLKDVLLANARAVRLSWGQRLSMLRSAAVGLGYLHSLRPPVVHGDVKSSNLLVDEGMVSLKVSDFGFARLKEDNATMTRCGTPCWTAPEIIRGEPCGESSDVYSLGIVMWEMLTRRQPFSGQNFMGVSLDVLEGKRPAIPSECPRAYAKFMQQCWHARAEKRPTMVDVVAFLSDELAEATTVMATDIP